MKKQIHYITYNDIYNGIYQSQVIDVLVFLNQNFDVEVSLISFVPARLWLEQRKLIKSKHPKAKVYPILGSVKDWKRTQFLFSVLNNKKTAICRGPLAFRLAYSNYKKTIYDGRAAVGAEVKEYDVTGNKQLDQLFINAEIFAVTNANFMISVSAKLINYWQNDLKIDVSNDKVVIIPCTLSSLSQVSKNNRKDNKIRVVYSGGTGPWQSFSKVVLLLDNLMSRQDNIEVLFLTKLNTEIKFLQSKHPNRCIQKWVSHDEVYNELSNCDYGILLRDNKITNQVASPVKFAEYLNAGLSVLISPNIGDFSQFVIDNNCGIIVEDEIPSLGKVAQKIEFKEICQRNFTKEVVKNQYIKLVEFC